MILAFFEATEQSFRAVMETIHNFEEISGTKVNLENSKLIQLDYGEWPEWFAQCRCTVVEDGHVIKYLCCPFGQKIPQQQEVQFLLSKMRNRLRRWTIFFLSKQSRLIFINYMLREMSTFYLMVLDCTGDGYNELEAICRQLFLRISSRPTGQGISCGLG
jgi:hypothetical protein